MVITSATQEVLVVGYPKSGNTWLTRLVAELINCPVKGFFEQPNNPEISIEGSTRQSNYVVFKGHQSFDKICQKIQHNNLIYVVRNVHDVAVSGANFFEFYPTNLVNKVICKSPILGDLYYRQTFISEKGKIRKMIRTLDKGDSSVPWCQIPWDEHIIPYLTNGVLVIKYEDLLANPEVECQKILSHIGINRSGQQMREAIKNQSFGTIKEKFKSNNQKKHEAFLREGKSGGWKQKLTVKQQKFLTNRFFDTLNSLGYLD
ncbi:MAG: sulfotransferase domain-containing protein [Symploca sp. SIO2E9]|nr:sulfotransferase domain-containing protein [Symploca sp. SIO2E9]